MNSNKSLSDNMQFINTAFTKKGACKLFTEVHYRKKIDFISTSNYKFFHRLTKASTEKQVFAICVKLSRNVSTSFSNCPTPNCRRQEINFTRVIWSQKSFRCDFDSNEKSMKTNVNAIYFPASQTHTTHYNALDRFHVANDE